MELKIDQVISEKMELTKPFNKQILCPGLQPLELWLELDPTVDLRIQIQGVL